MIASIPHPRPGLTSLFLAASLLGSPGSTADVAAPATPFSQIIAFGDSLTDTGRFYALTGLPPAPYQEGRFSNGPLWLEYVAPALGIRLDSASNYAIAGATTGRDNLNDVPGVVEFPGILDQVDTYLSRSSEAPGADPDALFVHWGGANDIFLMNGTPEQVVARAIANTVEAVTKLGTAGARHIMVVNLPDLGLTPLGRASGNGAGLSFLVAAYNQGLNLALDQLDGAGISTIRVDSATALQSMFFHPEEYLLVNVTNPALLTGEDPAGSLFWDTVHPTTRGHEVLAAAAVRALLDFYSPRPLPWKGWHPAWTHALSGLVHAYERH